MSMLGPQAMQPPGFPPGQPTAIPPSGVNSNLPPQPGEQNSGITLNFFSSPIGKTNAPPASPFGQPAPYPNANANGDSFQRSNSAPSSPASAGYSASTPPFFPNPAASPQQQLQDAYFAAEQARNNYLGLANQLNGQAYQTQMSQPQTPVAPFGLQPGAGMQVPQPMAQDPNANFMQQQMQAQAAQQAYLQQLQAMQAQEAQKQAQAQAMQQQEALAKQQLEQQLAMQQQKAQQEEAQRQAMQQAAMAQQQAAMQQPLQQPQQQPGMPQQQPGQAPQQGLGGLPVEELNRMIAQPNTLQEKVDAMEEIGVRGRATPETYDLLVKESLNDTSMLPPGQPQDDANYIRQAALWTIGMLNKSQNAQAPTDKLPGLKAIQQIINNKKSNPDVKAAAVQALQVIDRPQDKLIQMILMKAKKDANPDVSRLATQALSGQNIPLPGQQGAAPGQPGMVPPAGMMPGAMPGMLPPQMPQAAPAA